jgi:hypothetical protein
MNSLVPRQRRDSLVDKKAIVKTFQALRCFGADVFAKVCLSKGKTRAQTRAPE